MLRRIRRADWPFDIRRVPFFYGWVILLLSTLGILVSIPGQTMGMAVFTDPLIDALGLSRTQLSVAYMVGTIGSSLFLTRAGRLYDRFGGRLMVAVSSISLALMLMFISVTDQLSGLFGGGPFFSFVFIMLGYFGVRFFGQGVLTSASRNVLLLWFEKRRGLVSSARGVFVSFGFSLAPLALAWLIAVNDWRWAIWVLAGCCAGFSVFAYLFLRDDPTTCGVMVDGHSEDDAPAVAIAVINFTFAQARRSQLFWVLSLSLGIHSLFGTAVVFHIVSIFSEAGRTSAEAFGYFLPAAIGSTSVNLLVGWLADKRPLKPFLIMMLVSFILGGFGLLNLHSEWGYWLLIIGFGAGGGFWSVISNLGFIRNFGPLHLGEISGLCTAVMVFTSAIGPALFSVGLDVFGTYAAAEWLCIVALIVLLTVAIKVPHDHEQLSRG